MDSSTVMKLPSSAELELIYKALDVDEDKIENNLRLLKEWLRCESHLPSNMDEALLKSFLRGCKGNLEKTKVKTEKYLAAKTNLAYIFHNRAIVEKDYTSYLMHRCVFVSTKCTEEGNRIIIYRIPMADAAYFDFLKTCKYILLLLDFLLYFDMAASYDFVYDASNVTGQIISKLNLAAVKDLFTLFYNILPMRIRSIFVLNPNSFFDGIMTLAKSFMSKKIKDRVHSGKIEDVFKRYPKTCLPIEYGGTDRSFNDLCDDYLKLFKNNEAWLLNTEQVKLTGPLPEHKKNLCSFESFNMDGSFRKLNID